MSANSQQVCNRISVTHGAGPEPIEIHRGVLVKHPHPRHWHEEFHACAITGGGGYTEYRGTAYDTPPGSMFLLPPGEVHANRAIAEGCSYTNIYLPAPLICAAIERIAEKDHVPVFPIVIVDSDIHGGFLALCRVLEHSRSRLCRETAILKWIAILCERFGEKPPRSPAREAYAVRVAREYLDEHFDREIGLDELSRLTNLSPYYLNRSFGRQLGLPPHAYQIQVRLARAKALLRQNLPIAEVAFRTGFSDQSHLTRHFKRIVGVTPGAFQADRKNVQDLQSRIA